MKKLIEKMSIRRKFVFFVLIFLLPMLTIGLIMNIISLRMSQKEVSKTYTQSLRIFADKIDSNLQRYQSLASSLAADRNLAALNQAPVGADMSIVWEYAELLDRLRLFSAPNDIEGNITVYMPAKNRAFSSRDGILDLQGIDHLKRHRIGIWETDTDQNLSILYSSSGILTERSVLVTIEISPKTIQSLLSDFSKDSEGIGFLYYENSNILLPPEADSHQNKQLRTALSAIDGSEHDGILPYKQQQNYQVYYWRSENGSILYGYIYPAYIFLRTVYSWVIVMLLFVLTAIILLLLFSDTVRKTLINPIYKLIGAFESVKSGKLNTQIVADEVGEFGLLYHQFNEMTSRLSQTMDEIVQYQKLLESSKLKLLQSQINPHFLYNSLNFIYRMISAEQLDAAEQMTIYLGRYFTYATKINLEETTIDEEIKNIETYTAIQKMRFSSDIRLNIIISDPSIQSTVIPRLLLQPIVENVFSHGTISHEKTLIIEISFTLTDNRILISVTDNGKGMDPGVLKQVQESLGDLQQKEGFALRNIFWRLKLIYKEEAQMEITAKEGEGTKVTLSFPTDGSPGATKDAYV